MDLSGCENLKEIPDLSTATNLIDLDLSKCESLKEIPDLSNAIHLRKMNLSGCKNLKEIPNLSNATNLEELDMSGRTSLEALPTNINLVSLTSLNLSGCSQLTSFPQLSTSIKELNLSDTAIEEVPSWIENITRLTRLWMQACQKLRKISATIWNLKHLQHVDFTECGGITSVSDASLVKTEFLFFSCFNLDGDVQEFILQSDFKYAVLPGKQVPTYYTHRTCGTSLTVPLPQSSLSQNNFGFTACIVPGPVTGSLSPKIIIVHWKFRGVTGMCNIDPVKDFCEMDHMVVFHFGFCPQEEVDDPPSQLDVEFEFELHNSTLDTKEHDLQTCPILPCKIKECGVRVLDVSPSLDANDRRSETEYTDQSGENDEETERSKK